MIDVGVPRLFGALCLRIQALLPEELIMTTITTITHLAVTFY